MIRVSTSCIDITPSYPIYILGHSMRNEKSKGVHDPIESVFLWLEVEGCRFLFISMDLLGVDYAFTNEVRKCIANSIDVNEQYIFIGATHTHSGPLINQRDSTKSYDERYRKEIIEKIVQGACNCFENNTVVHSVQCRQGESKGFYGNRDELNAYGDQTITLIEFLDEEECCLGVMMCMACHSTVLSPLEYKLSADLLGGIRRKLTNAYGVVPVVLNGSAGDMSTRLYRKGNDFEELERVSEGVFKQIVAFKTVKQLTLTIPCVKHFHYVCKSCVNEEKTATKLIQLKNQLKQTINFDDRKWILSEIQDCQEQLTRKFYNFDFETSILNMGDIEFVILPCEISALLGKMIKDDSKAKVCMLIGYANDQTTYVVEASAFEKGHGGLVTKLLKGEAENYVETIKKVRKGGCI